MGIFRPYLRPLAAWLILALLGMQQALGRKEGYCLACFTGDYPVAVDFHSIKTGFEKKEMPC